MRAGCGAALFVSVLSVSPWLVFAAEAPVRAIVLGIAQDGGVPHIGCAREPCASARRDPSLRRRVACLGLVDERSGRRFLIDAAGPRTR